MLRAEDLLDPILVAQIGNVDAQTLKELFGLCTEAVTAVLGPAAWNFLSQDELMAERTVPWVWDLGRGLHFQSFRGPKMPKTSDLINQLSSNPLNDPLRARIAAEVDGAFVLTEDRIAEYIQGRGAIKLDPMSRERAFPWYPRLQLGYRIRLTTEALRLIRSC